MSVGRELKPVHHPDRRTDVMMPYAPAIVVRRGQQAPREAAAHGAEPHEADAGHYSSATAMAVISSLQRGCVARRETSTVVVVGR